MEYENSKLNDLATFSDPNTKSFLEYFSERNLGMHVYNFKTFIETIAEWIPHLDSAHSFLSLHHPHILGWSFV